MKVLYVCHRVPFPPQRGGKIRPFNMIAHLAKSHQVTVASLARSQQEFDESAGLRDYCHELICERVTPAGAVARMLATGPTRRPFSMGYFYSPNLARRIRETLAREQFDLIFVHCSSVAQYVESLGNIPKILDFGDMDSQKWQIYQRIRSFPASWIYGMEGWKLEKEERRLAQHFDDCGDFLTSVSCIYCAIQQFPNRLHEVNTTVFAKCVNIMIHRCSPGTQRSFGIREVIGGDSLRLTVETFSHKRCASCHNLRVVTNVQPGLL